jgi:flagellar biogenesis protein FliO
MMDLYLHMGLALIAVSGLVLVLGYVLKKRQGGDGLMKVMGYQSLGPKKGIAMVKVGAEVLLVGVTATDVKLLKSMDAFADGAGARPLPEPEARVITADAVEKLNRLKALKDKVYAIK